MVETCTNSLTNKGAEEVRRHIEGAWGAFNIIDNLLTDKKVPDEEMLHALKKLHKELYEVDMWMNAI